MSREKTGSILKVLVKLFFIEKEVTSTLVMDSLYSGLKALEGQHKGLKSKGKYLETEELPAAIVRMDKDTFVLVDDALTLFERAAIESLPPKDKKAPQNRTKDGSLGEEFNKDLFECDDRWLTELGRRTIEIFTLVCIFSKIEVAYQEDVSLKRQEELIREEEMACSAESAQKARHGAADKEKKSKKKQGIKKRSNRKGKDKGKDEKHNSIAQKIKMDQDIYTVEREVFVVAEMETAVEKFDAIEDIVSDASNSIECVPEILPLDSEDRDMGPVNWDTNISELHLLTQVGSNGISGLSSLQNGMEGRTSSVVDDTSSTCLSDSVPFVAVIGPHKGDSGYQKNRSPGRLKSSTFRGTNNESKANSEPAEWVKPEPSEPTKSVLDVGCTIDASGSSKAVHTVSQVADRVVDGVEKRVLKVLIEEKIGSLHKSSVSNAVGVEVSPNRASCAVSLPGSPPKNIPTIIQSTKLEPKRNATNDLPTAKKSSPVSYINKQAYTSSSSENSPKKPTAQHTAKTAKNTPTAPTLFITSRPLSAPLIPISMPAVTVAPAIQVAPILPRLAISAGQLGQEPPQSYRNVIVGGDTFQNHPLDPGASTSIPYSQPPSQSFSFGMVNCHDMLPNQSSLSIESPQRDLPVDRAPLINNTQGYPTGPSSHQGHLLPDDFPHLDIINDLLDDEHGIGNLSVSHRNYQGFGGEPHYLNRQVSFPGDPSLLEPPMSSCRFDRARGYGEDWFQHGYGFSRTPYHAHLDMVNHGGLWLYANSQVDNLVPPNQWQMGGSDLALASFRSTGCDPYRVAEYQNRPSSGL